MCIPHCSLTCLTLAENRAESTANAKYCKNLPGKSTRNSVFLNQFGKLDDTCSTCSTFIHWQTRSLGNELEVAEWLRLRFLAVLHLCKAGDDFRRMPQLDEPWKSWLFVCAWTDCYKASICRCIVMFFLLCLFPLRSRLCVDSTSSRLCCEGTWWRVGMKWTGVESI